MQGEVERCGPRVEYKDGLCKGLWATSRTASRAASRTNSRRNVIKRKEPYQVGRASEPASIEGPLQDGASGRFSTSFPRHPFPFNIFIPSTTPSLPSLTPSCPCHLDAPAHLGIGALPRHPCPCPRHPLPHRYSHQHRHPASTPRLPPQCPMLQPPEQPFSTLPALEQAIVDLRRIAERFASSTGFYLVAICSADSPFTRNEFDRNSLLRA